MARSIYGGSASDVPSAASGRSLYNDESREYFLALNDALRRAEEAGNRIIWASETPTTREDGFDLEIGDLWISTSNATVHSWTGTTFAALGGAGSGETYALVEVDQTYYLRRDSDGSLVEPGVPVGADEIIAETIDGVTFVALARDETVLSDAIETKMTVEVESSTGESNLLLQWLSYGGRLILNHAMLDAALAARIQTVNGVTPDAMGNVEIGTSGAVSTDATITGTGTSEDPLGVSANHVIGGMLALTATEDKVVEVANYAPDATRIGQHFQISTVNSVNDIADITINSEPSSGDPGTTPAQRVEILLNKATAISDGELRVPTAQAVLDYVTSVETNPVTAAGVRAVLQNDTGNRGIQWAIDSSTGDIIGVANEDVTKADAATTVTDSDIGLNSEGEVVTIRVGSVIHDVRTTEGRTAAQVEAAITGRLNDGAGTPTDGDKAYTVHALDLLLDLKQDDLTVEQLAVVNADPFESDDYTRKSASVIDADIGLNDAGEVVTITTADGTHNIHTGTEGQSAAQVQTAITGRLDAGPDEANNNDNTYTTTEADRLLGLKQDTLTDYTPSVWNAKQNQITGDSETISIPGAGPGGAALTFTGGSGGDAVLYTAQTLTEAQKEIARNNIDAAGHLMLNSQLSLELADTVSVTGTMSATTSTPTAGNPANDFISTTNTIPAATGDYLVYIQDGQTDYSIFQVVIATGTFLSLLWITSGSGTRPAAGSQTFTFDLYRPADNFSSVSTQGFNDAGEAQDSTIANLIQFGQHDLVTENPIAGVTRVTLNSDVIRDGDFTVTGGEAVSVNIDGTAVPFAGGSSSGQSAAQVQTAITGRLNDGTGTSTDSDQAYTTTEADRLLAGKQDAATVWTQGTLYEVGDTVLVPYNGDTVGFRCIVEHTSDGTVGGLGNGQPRWNVPNSNWNQIGFQDIAPWITGYTYFLGDVVLFRDTSNGGTIADSGLYMCILGHSSQEPPNATYWLKLGGSGAGGVEVLSSDPSSPTDGQVWYNSSQELIKYFDGELTLDIAKFLGYFSTDPTHSSANHSDGDMWYNTTENEFKYFSGSGVVHTIITNLDSITALSDGQAVLDSIAAEATTRAEDDAIEATARIAGDEAERDFVETTLHVDAADSQSYYQFSGVPAIFAEDPAIDYGITIAMPETITDEEELVQAENIGETTKVFKLTLRYGDGANDTKQYVVTTGGYNFTISDERTSETFRLPTIEGTYSAASVHINGTSTRRQDCFLAIGGWYGRIAQVDMAHVLNVSNGDILAGRSLEVGQDYSEHTIADNNNTAVVGLVFDNQTTGSHTGINAYALQRRNRIVRYRAAASGGLFSFRNGNSVVDRFNPSRVPNVVETNQVEESNWLGLKLVTIQNAISATAANGDGNRLTYAVGDKMLVAFGEAVASTSAGIFVPGIATTKNPSTFAGGNVNLGLFYTGGEDPSEEYSNYSGSGSNNNEADFNAHIFDMEYSNASGAWTFFFGGQTVGETAIATSAAGFHGTSIWNMATISAATKAGAGGIIRSVALGGNIAGLASSTHFWVTTELGALWVNTTPWLAAGYGSDALVQAHTNPNDPTSDIKRDFTFRGFQYFDQHGSIGAGDDGHIYRLVINPEVTFTVTFGNVTHTATYRFNDDTADMHAFFGNPASYSPTLVGSGVSLTTAAPGGEPNDQLYLDYAVNGQNTPVVSYQWVGVLSTTDDDFETYSPFRRIDLANTVVDIHYPDGGATYHIPLSSNINDYTVGAEANGAVDQIAAVVNTHTAQGHSAVRVDAGFADTITNTRPVLRLDQTGTHALQNAPTITIAHPSGQNTGTLAVENFADGGYDTIGRPGGLFDPNNYDTRAETDAKIAAIVSTHGYAENIVANAGNDSTTYTRLDRIQIGTEIYDVEVDPGDIQTAITGRLNDGDGTSTDADQAYTVTEVDRLLATKGAPTTAALVEAFFADSTASRGVSYSESGGVISTTVAADTSKQDVIDSNNRLPTVNIGTGAINNAELNTLNGIDTSQTIQTQLDAKQATISGTNRLPATDVGNGNVDNTEFGYLEGVTSSIQTQLDGKAGSVPEIYQNAPTGTTGNGLFLTTNNNAGTQLRFTALPDTGTGGSALKGILTSEFVATSITGGGNATWTESAGLQFTSTTAPVANTRYILRFDVVGAVLFEFNANDVQFANSQWQIHRADVVIISGNVSFGDNLAFNPAGTMFANIYSGDISLGSNITLVDGVLDSSGGGVTDAFRYSQLLTGGFLVQRTTAMDTSARRAYTDTQGAYGATNTTYYYEATSKSWFDVASGGTALISFPST